MAVKKDQLFSQAEKMWDLKRLYSDLANIKGKELTPGEKLHLRGLLCGCSPTELAEQLNKNLNGLEADLCNTIYSYVKKLLKKSNVDNWRNISEWLENSGYRAIVTAVLQQIEGLKLPVENLEALIKIQYNQCGPTFQVHFHGVATLSYEDLKKMMPEAGVATDPKTT